MGRKMDKAAMLGARLIRDTAKRLVPVDTGALRKSIRVVKLKPRRYEVGAGEFYAGFVEFGTVRMPAQPYLRPAIRMRQAELLSEFERSGREVVRRDYV